MVALEQGGLPGFLFRCGGYFVLTSPVAVDRCHTQGYCVLASLGTVASNHEAICHSVSSDRPRRRAVWLPGATVADASGVAGLASCRGQHS